MSELLLCPFCGGEAFTYSVETWWVSHACYCLGKYVGTKEYATEAEAIAAWNTRVDYHGYEQAAIEAWESIKAWNARATNGTLTAEQVKRIHEIIEKHWRDLPAEYDMPEATALPEYSYDWQAIADELNSRAERTCECIMCAYFENKSTCGAYCNYFDRELGDDYDGGCTWGVLSGSKVVGE